MNPAIDIAIQSDLWSALPGLRPLTERVIAAAMATAGAEIPDRAELSCLFCDDGAIRALNKAWRGIDKATNVLSFPAATEPAGPVSLLGDIAIAFETCEREASRDERPLRDHVSHLIVHGFLHLVGHDHEDEDEASKMEAMETRILADLGIADPYAATELVGDTAS